MVMLLSLSIRKADVSIAGYNPLPVRRLSSTSHLDKPWDIQFLHFTNTRNERPLFSQIDYDLRRGLL